MRGCGNTFNESVNLSTSEFILERILIDMLTVKANSKGLFGAGEIV